MFERLEFGDSKDLFLLAKNTQKASTIRNASPDPSWKEWAGLRAVTLLEARVTQR